MNTYVENPKLGLEVLQKIAEEIPSGVSAEDVKKIIVQLKDAEELTSYISKNVAKSLKQELENFWISEEVETKLAGIKDLKQRSTDTNLPPLSPRSKINVIKYQQLLLQKQLLLEKVKEIQEKSSKLQNEVKQDSDLIKKQLQDIKEKDLNN